MLVIRTTTTKREKKNNVKRDVTRKAGFAILLGDGTRRRKINDKCNISTLGN